MGVVNVTPDSFFDGNRHFSTADAVAHAEQLLAEGADILDIGGESTRPGALPVALDEELRRVIPVVEALAGRVRISIDTMKPEVARAAVAAGASLINDVTASLAPVAAETGVGIVLMHMCGTPQTMQEQPQYVDVVSEVIDFLNERAGAARALGVTELYVDPGIGFGKTTEHNIALLRALPELVAQGTPVLVGTSRKRFLGEISSFVPGQILPPEERLEGSLATATFAMSCGVSIVRVHDVRATMQAALLMDALAGVGGGLR